MIFKINDEVICINNVNADSLTINKIYKIVEVNVYHTLIINDLNQKHWFLPYRFVKNTRLNKVLYCE